MYYNKNQLMCRALVRNRYAVSGVGQKWVCGMFLNAQMYHYLLY